MVAINHWKIATYIPWLSTVHWPRQPDLGSIVAERADHIIFTVTDGEVFYVVALILLDPNSVLLNLFSDVHARLYLHPNHSAFRMLKFE